MAHNSSTDAQSVRDTPFLRSMPIPASIGQITRKAHLSAVCRDHAAGEPIERHHGSGTVERSCLVATRCSQPAQSLSLATATLEPLRTPSSPKPQTMSQKPGY